MRKIKFTAEELKTLIQQGLSSAEIANQKKCSECTVRAYMKKYGIDIPKGFYAIPGKKAAKLKMMSDKFKGEGNPFYGQKHSDKTKQRMSINHADFNGNKNPFRQAWLKDPLVGIELSERRVEYWALKTPEEKYNQNKKNIAGDLSSGHWTRIKQAARVRNIQIEITPEEIWQLFLDQNKKCALTGIELNLKTLYEITASLDRINSNDHYHINNVQWVHKDINVMKLDLSQDEFISICYNVTKYDMEKNANT